MEFVKGTIASIEQDSTWDYDVQIVTPTMALDVDDMGLLVEDANLHVGDEVHLLLRTMSVSSCVVVGSIHKIPMDTIWHRRDPNEGLVHRLMRAKDIDYIGSVLRRAFLRDCISECRHWNRDLAKEIHEAESPDVVLIQTEFGVIAVGRNELPEPYKGMTDLPQDLFLGCLTCGPLTLFAIF